MFKEFNFKIFKIFFFISFFITSFNSYVYAEIKVGDTYQFEYSGQVNVFEVPATGYYRLETWGGQGGNETAEYHGGYGGYATGVVKLNKGDKLYIYVGGAGGGYTASGTAYGGFNGGGSAYGTTYNGVPAYVTGGGGATHIATKEGLLSTLSNSLSDILIVSGGGGGSSWWSKNGTWTGVGGSGGGYIGATASTTVSAYPGGAGGTQSSGAAFGLGYGPANYTAGGGGGLYGGRGGTWSASGGGSGYIANPLLMSSHGVTKAMYCFNCPTSTDADTLTTSVSTYNANPLSNVPKSGHGAAKITVLEPTNTNSKLKDIKLSIGSLNETFDPEKFTYQVSVTSDDYLINVEGTVLESTSTVQGNGEYTLKVGSNNINLTVTADNGNVSIYTIEVIKPASPYQYLTDIKIDDVSIDDFNPTELEYTVDVPYDTESLALETVKGKPGQEVYLPNDLTLHSGLNKFEIIVIAEDGVNTATYHLNINKEHSSLLKSVTLGDYEFDYNPNTFEYTVKIMASTMSIPVKTIPYDEEAKVKLSGFGYIKDNATATIIVTEPNSTQTIYKINLIKDEKIVETAFDFPYTGSVQTFVAPNLGYYRLETWGAQGGSQTNVYRGGFGGYSTGVVKLDKGDTLYIYVGGAGQNYVASGTAAGGYNGGGSAPGTSYAGHPAYVTGGGGATHIATKTGLLSTLSDSLSDILIVSGGGGGSSWWSSGTTWTGTGGSGGGYVGGRASSSTNYAGGTGGTQENGASFGQGFGGAYYTAGGGGGLYGGNGGIWSASGGGSGYIGNSKLVSYKNITKSMYGYGVSASTGEETYTINTNKYSGTPTSYYAKSGSGFARITLMPQPSENNFLSYLDVYVNDEKKDYSKEENGPTEEFDMVHEEYYLNVSSTEVKANLDAKLEDDSAKVTGLGEVDVKAGDNVYNITVTAESGAVKIYKVHINRPADANSKPLDIKISGLVPSLCTDEYCIMDPEDFDPDTENFKITVPSQIKKIKLETIKAHPYQSVFGDGEFELAEGENTFTISVISEDKNNTSTYTFIITRDMSNNNDLNLIKVIEPSASTINFEPTTLDYYLNVPSNYTNYQVNENDSLDNSVSNILQLYIETASEEATFVTKGPAEFVSGLNEVSIIVTAKNGKIKTYQLHIYREKDSNVYLSNLIVKSKDKTLIYPIKPTFNKLNLGTYTATVPNDVTEVYVEATSESSTTSVAGAEEKTLNIGNNYLNIILTSENADIESYQLNIIRQKNSNANLSDITISDNNSNTYTLTPEFNNSELNYEVIVNEGIREINISATPEVSTTTYHLLDGTNIKIGENTKRIMATAEDGTTIIYTLKITRPVSTSNYLSDILLNNESLVDFSKETYEYNIEVENDSTSVDILGVKENELSTVSGNGTYYLSVGDNRIDLIVKSPDDEERTYTLNIKRKANSNAYLKMISTTEGPVVTTHAELTYTLEVGSDVEKITITPIAEESATTVDPSVINLNTLNTGDNLVSITTNAENGDTLTYTLNIIKAASDNNYLDNLILEEGALSPKFTSTTEYYEAKVARSVTSGTFHVTLQDERATYKILGANNFQIGENIVIIRVTSESGKTRDYEVKVIRQELTSNFLLDLSVKGSITNKTYLLNPLFIKEQLYYEVTVPYNETKVNVSGKLEDVDATVTGLGDYPLNVGENLVVIEITSLDGKIRNYQVNINRLASSDARLKELQIDNAILSPSFNKDIFSYTTKTTDESLDFTKIVPVEENATYEIIDNKLTDGEGNQVIIRVTAPDDMTTKDYVINVTKVLSDNNNLLNLEVEGFNISPNFASSTTLYTLIVSGNINSVNIIATTEEKNATIKGDGVNALSSGINNLVVEVTSASGKKKSYVIVITKEASDNNKLDDLRVINGQMSQTYTNEIEEYDVTIPYEVDELELEVILSDNTAKYEVIDNHDLVVGQNVVKVLVTAENGDVKLITLNVTRNDLVSALLKDLKIKNYQITPEFNSNIFNYDVLINNETEKLDLAIETLDKNASYIVLGNENLHVGSNEIKIIVTSSDGTLEETYLLNVTKQAFANDTLDYLYTSEGDLTPDFNGTIMEYTIEVPYQKFNIELFGEAVDKSATVTGVGIHELSVGENNFTVVVETLSGVKRVYYIKVIRGFDLNNYLETLDVKIGSTSYPLNETFSKYINDYTLNVPVGTESINLVGSVSENSTTNDLGFKTIIVGENVIKITVTGQAGNVNIYTITVTRSASSNNYLISLIPSIGELEPDFSYEETNYTLNLDSSASLLSFDVVTEDNNAKVTGIESLVVPDGMSTRTITVEAEDGSTRTYTITVSKERTDNALLSSLSVTDYPFTEVFEPNTFEYHITVPNEKKIILPSEVIATPQDKGSTITKSNSLNLVTTGPNEFLVRVTAPDGFTKQDYKIIIEREKAKDAALLDLVVNTGYLTTNFNPNVLEYDWIVPKAATITKEDVTATPSDINAVITKTEKLIITEEGPNIFFVEVTSEDGSVTTTYKLNVSYELSNDASASSLIIDKGIYEPDFSPETLTYDVYEYIDVTEIDIMLTPTSSEAKVIGNGLLTIIDDEMTHTLTVTAEDGTTKIYTLNIHRTIKKDEGLKNISLNGLEEYGDFCTGGNCTLTPEFISETTEYSIKVPYEYEVADFIIETINEQQTTKIIRDNEETSDYSLMVGNNKFTIRVYDGMKKLTKEYIINVERSSGSNDSLISIDVEEMEIILDVGEEKRIKYSFNPADTSYTDIKWVIEDENIVHVDDGKVTALNVGTTIVKIVSTHDEEIFAEIKVKVIRKQILSDIYDIRRFSEDESEEVLLKPVDYVIGSEPENSIEDFKKNFLNDPDTLYIYDKDGNEITDISAFVGTEMEIKLIFEGKEYDSLKVVVRGDLNGDGIIDGSDYIKLKNYMLSKIEFNYLEFQCSELNGDEIIDGSDYIKLKNYMLSKLETLN